MLQPSPLQLVVVGARGRLGQLIIAAAEAQQMGASAVGRGDDLADVLQNLVKGPVVVVDVATPGASAHHARLCATRQVPYLCATTGLSADDHAALDAAGAAIPVLVAANLSPGAHLVALLSATAARAMADADCEIVEVHHRKKKDAPSGTALMLARAVEQARASLPPRPEAGGSAQRFVKARDGDAPRQPGDIGVVAVRGGDVVGEHTVTFFVDGERVEIAHKVSDRGIFAKGALLASRFLVDQKPGRYQMTDVLRARLVA